MTLTKAILFINFEKVLHILLVPSSLNLNIFIFAGMKIIWVLKLVHSTQRKMVHIHCLNKVLVSDDAISQEKLSNFLGYSSQLKLGITSKFRL